MGEIRGGDAPQAMGRWVYVGGEGLGGGGVAVSKVDDTATGGGDRTEERVAAAGQSHHLAADGVFLGGELKGHKCGCLKVGKRRSEGIEALSTQKEGDVLEEKGLCVRHHTRIFARAKKEEKGKTEHVGDGQIHN
mmetsp:Transcript_41240/g.119437  ORF Transcript_41240/g.119437 Transcript_41240/m.119437 type:complete len:135 (+) Transcript_41240:663-1067(+)